MQTGKKRGSVLNIYSNRLKKLQRIIVFLLSFFLLQFYALEVAAQTTFTVTNTNDSGAGSFREAINQANAESGLSIIEFNIAGTGPHVIQPLTQYVSFQEPVTLDATTQSGYTAGSPQIVLDGSQNTVTDGISGLVFTVPAGNSTIKGFSIINFAEVNNTRNFAIRFVSDNNTVQGNLIGLDPSGNPGPNGVGISTLGSTGNQIGGTLAEERNIISANNVGIDLDTGSDNNVLQGNYIGTSLDGTAEMGNKFNLQILGSSNNIIGGNTPEERNIVAGAYFENINGQLTGGSGIVLSRTVVNNTTINPTGNVIQGNYIGTDVTGTDSLANDRAGILLLFGASNNTIGGEGSGEGNLISGNGLYGIFIQGSQDNPVNSNLIQGNYIGTNAAGTDSLANAIGIWMMGNNNANRIGTNGNTAGGNVISGNDLTGLLIIEGSENTITGNLIGTTADGLQELGNKSTGVEIQGDSNTLGGPNTEDRNVISGNRVNGVYLNESVDNQVIGNIVGLDINGTSALPEQVLGIRISGGSQHLISRNTVSGNESNGILLDGFGVSQTGTTSNIITGNKVGTDIAGTTRIANRGSGIYLSQATDNTIGGVQSTDRNIISGNGGTFEGFLFDRPGIRLGENSNNNTIQGNYIGTDINGDVVSSFGNFGDGIIIESGSSDNTVGLDAVGFGSPNRIAGNGVFNGNGVVFSGTSINNRVVGNEIYSNDGIGIDFEDDGITANDIDDADTGPNNLQNFPELQSAVYAPGTNNIAFTYQLNSNPANAAYPVRIDFYKDAGNRQGEQWIGSASYSTTDFGSSKEVVLDVPAGVSLAINDPVIATATDNNGNTSEFGASISVTEVTALLSLPSPASEAAWHFLGSPTIDDTYGSLLSSVWTQGAIGASVSSGNPTVYTWDQSGQQWTAVTDLTQTSTNGVGFIGYIYEDDDPSTTGTQGGWPKTLTLNGTAKTGTTDFSINYSSGTDANLNGFNLVANPYASSIDWESPTGWTRTNVADAIYIWDASANSGNGAYRERVGGVGDDINVIAPFQGFFVQATVSGAALSATEDVQTTGGVFLVSPAPEQPISLLKLQVNTEGFEDDTYLVFRETSVSGKDSGDAVQLPSHSARKLQLYSTTPDGDALAINSINDKLNGIVELPLYINTTESGQYEMSWKRQDLPLSWEVTLKDMHSGRLISLLDSDTYNFEADAPVTNWQQQDPLMAIAEKKKEGTPRFLLRINPGVAEPISNLPSRIELNQNYPNPFNPTTVIRFGLPEASRVSLEIYNILGQQVSTLINDELSAGFYEVNFDASRLSSGTYLYKLTTGNTVTTKKMLLIK